MPADEPEVPSPVTTRDGSRTLFSDRYGQTLHSEHGALTEAKWVFLQASGVAERLEQGVPTAVLEVGFGTGLNFLVTADAACTAATPLRYTALEQALPHPAAVAGLRYADHLDHPEIDRALRAKLDLEHSGPKLEIDVCQASLTLMLGEATTARLPSETYHAIYHDAFSPDANPELWADAFLATLTASLAPGGVLVTYSVKGTVRRALAAMALDVRKRPGPPGGKREMLWARKPSVPAR